MHPLSFRSPKTAVRESSIHGRGLFAAEPISRGEVVAIKGGAIVGRATLATLPDLGAAEIQVTEDHYIAPINPRDRDGSMIFSNHSCAPNIGVLGQIVFVAMRDIAAGEELTHDWAMTDDDDGEISCRCGAATCRKRVTGKDWQRPELQARYDGYFSSYIREKIRRAKPARRAAPPRAVAVREARRADRAFVLETARRLADFELPPWRAIPEIVAGEVRTLDGFFRTPPAGTVLLLAEADGAPLGFAYVETGRDYFSGQGHAHIGILAVARESEGLGVGSALIEASEEWARKIGLARITLNVFERNRRARGLYERLGYLPETLRYTKGV